MIPNGIDVHAIREGLLERTQARHRLGLPKEGIIVGTIANFYPAKDLPAACAAYAEVHRAHPEIRFCLIGEGPERPEIEAAIQKHGLGKAIFVVGAREQAAQFLNAFDLFVLPSKKEGMPFVLLEAAAAGLLIVTTDVGAHGWMLPEATIVPPEQPAALARAIVAAIENPQKPSYEQSLARFDEETCFRSHYDLLTKE